MKKLARFIILSVLFALTVIFLYSLFPIAAWIFGAPFKEVSQSVVYTIIGGIGSIVSTAVLFEKCFNENFYPKD